MKFPVALQLYSVRDDLARDFADTLRQVAAFGYDGVEFAGLYDLTPAKIRRQLDACGLKPLSAHVPYEQLIADPDGVVAIYQAIGCPYIAIPYLVPEMRPGTDGFAQVIEGARRIGEAARKAGVQLLYHNHDFEFARIDGEYALDLLYRSVPADLLQTQIDTCWVNVAGEDPAAYVRKYAGRAPLVHLKDFVMPGRKPAKLYDLIGIDDSSSPVEPDTFGFRPLGQGVQNIPAILDAASDAGSFWMVVEQDQPAPGKTPLQCADESLQYLRRL